VTSGFSLHGWDLKVCFLLVGVGKLLFVDGKPLGEWVENEFCRLQCWRKFSLFTDSKEIFVKIIIIESSQFFFKKMYPLFISLLLKVTLYSSEDILSRWLYDR